MQKLKQFFPMLIIVVALALSVIIFIIPELPNTSTWIYEVEITGSLSEGDLDIQPQYFASGLNDTYTALKSWGIVRGKNGGLPRANPGEPEIIAKYNSIYLADTSQKKVYLTFDEGYENGYTGKILDVLYENKVNAIFFITGPYLEKEELLIKRMLDEGHAVGNHTIRHKSLPLLDDKELEEEIVGLDKRFYDKYGENMVYLRPPKGEYSERTLDISSKLGYVNVFWSFAYDDWAVDRQRGWEYAFEKVKNNLHNGEILLLHVGGKRCPELLGVKGV